MFRLAVFYFFSPFFVVTKQVRVTVTSSVCRVRGGHLKQHDLVFPCLLFVTTQKDDYARYTDHVGLLARIKAVRGSIFSFCKYLMMYVQTSAPSS
jgi:hypothetical protein